MKHKKLNKLDKSKRSSHNPDVFKHDCSLEHDWRKQALPENLYFSKNFKIILICICVLKSENRFFY